jgi:hypothetical protein
LTGKSQREYRFLSPPFKGKQLGAEIIQRKQEKLKNNTTLANDRGKNYGFKSSINFDAYKIMEYGMILILTDK